VSHDDCETPAASLRCLHGARPGTPQRYRARGDRGPPESEALIETESFRPRAVVFDLDGTLADNMHWHARAFRAFVAQHHLPPITEEVRRRIDGKRNAEIMPILFERPLSAEEVASLAWEKEDLYRSLSRGGIQPILGLSSLLEALATHGIPAAIATSAPRENLVHTLGELGLADRFRSIALSDEVPRGKPFPDVYLRAAQGLGVDPSACLAFEDAPVGVAAARAAGMRCLALTSTFRAEAFENGEGAPHGVCGDYVDYLAGEGRWLTVVPSAGR
jgi:beta-phosphoglucomutase